MEIRNSKIQKFGNFPVSQLPQKVFVAQTWQWMSFLINDSKYRGYGPKRARFTPKGGRRDRDGQDALVETETYLILSP